MSLPSSPIETLDMSSPELMTEINKIVKRAEETGEWKRPYKDAATAMEEMKLEDMAYWVYKCKYPVIQPERENEILFKSNINSIKGLPFGFQKQKSISFSAIGDLLYADGLQSSRNILYDNVYDLIFSSSISYANFESPITTQPLIKEVISDRAPPVECCNKDQAETLLQHKGKYFSILNTSNNHIFDMGTEGIDTTLTILKEKGILNVGLNESVAQVGHPRIVIKDGIKLGFISYTFGINGHSLPQEESYRINIAKLLSVSSEPEIEPVKQQIDKCKQEDCDFIIASMHWGFEFEMFPRKRQIEAAHKLAEYGADAIICHHPHVIQPFECYKTHRDPNRIVPIAYSLGSLTWGFTAPQLALSLIENLQIAKGMMNDHAVTYIEEASVTPVFRNIFFEENTFYTKIEKLEDSLTRPNSLQTDYYMAELKRYSDLVLGL